jgi:LuxR family transcriptional regulator, maltose regulon positive regulatory protein
MAWIGESQCLLVYNPMVHNRYVDRATMTDRLLETKFYLPARRTGDVPRPRLLETLQTGLSENRKLTLVSAPAGYGKTTLITDWLHSLAEDYRVAWLSLDEGDNETTRFLGYWISTFGHIDETLGQDVRSMLGMAQIVAPTAVMHTLINELVVFKSPIVVVLDDYHVITNPTLHESIEYFIEHQPRHVHLVMATREDPPLPLARMRTRKQMTEIRAHHLRFTPEESRHFFNHSMRLNLEMESVSTLEERTEGWAAGMQLAAMALQNLPNQQDFIQTFRGSHRYILDYLAEEVLRQQSGEIRNFLFRTAVLEKFNAQLCNAVSGYSDSQNLIFHLEKTNLFIIPLDNERIWYRYHHLFAEYLRTGLTRSEQQLLQEKASQWYEENDLVFEAVKYAFLSGNMELAANVIERVIQKVSAWSSGEITTLVGWLEALPAQLLRARPALSLQASRVWYIRGRIELAEKYLDLAEQALQELPKGGPHTEKLLAIAAVYRSSLAVVRGHLGVALERATYALNQLPEEEFYARSRAAETLGFVHELSGNLEKAGHSLMQASDLGHTAGVSFMALVSRCEAALVQINQGKLDLATQTVQQGIQRVGGKQIPPIGFAWYVLAEIAWERNELSSAEQYLMDGLKLSKQGGLIDDQRYELMSLARLKKSTGDIAAAMSAIEQAHAIVQTFQIPRLVTHCSAHRVRIQLANGMLDRANDWAQEYQELRSSHPVEYTREYEDLTLTRVHLANGEHQKALKILGPLWEQAEAAGRIRTCIEAAILLSLVEHAQNKTTVALEWLVKALIGAEPEGFLRLFLDEGSPIAGLLRKARYAAPKFVDELLRAFSCQTEAATHAAQHPANDQLIAPLSEQEFRVLRLIVAGKSNQEIAGELVITLGTAKWHVHNILQKLGVSNRPQAIARARDLDIE